MRNKLQLKFILPLLIVMLLIPAKYGMASVETKTIIITGKVINTAYGKPVENHEVFIFSEFITSQASRNINSIWTDEEGFFYDTIETNQNNGSFRVYTYDYFGKKSEQTLYFRFIDYSASNIFVADFEIYMPYHPDILQARFKYFQKNGNDRFSYYFFDQTKNNSVYCWHWDFGDGQTSELENPKHVFPGPGLYKVRLTVSSIIDHKEETSLASMYINIPDRSYYHMGGHCFAGYFPIDKGLAFLYLMDEKKSYIPIDTAKIDTLGYYYFYEIPEGEYCIKVQPQLMSEFYSEMIPTYYGDKAFWEQAYVINHHQTDWEYDVHLIEGFGLAAGDCSINGNVSFGDTTSGIRNKPAEGIDFLLLNNEGQLLSTSYSDENGNFTFPQINDGTYWLTADVTGYDQKKMMVQLSDENPVIDDIQIIIENGDINMGIFTSETNQLSMIRDLYPNPASDLIKLNLSVHAKGEAMVQIIDFQGKLISSEIVQVPERESTIIVSTSRLKNGAYLLQLTQNGNTTGKQFIVNR